MEFFALCIVRSKNRANVGRQNRKRTTETRRVPAHYRDANCASTPAPLLPHHKSSLVTDRLSVHGDPLRRKHSHPPVRVVGQCLYVEIGGKVVGRAHHRRWG